MTAPRTFLFLHATPGRSSDWDPLLALAPAGFRVHAIDLPDHGEAADDRSDDLEATLRFVEQTIDAIDGPVVLVGHGFGAWLAAFASARFGAPVERLVAINGLSGLPEQNGAEFTRLGGALVAGEMTLDDVVPIAIERFAATSGLAEEQVAASVTSQSPARVGRAVLRLARLAEPRYRVPAFDVPTTIVHTTSSVAVPLELGLELAECARRKTVHVLDLPGHLPHFTHPERIAPLVFG